MRLAGKKAIVTGGASGFGKGIALKFVREGADVIVADVNGDAAMETARELGVSAHTLDVASAESWAEVAQAHGTPDILVNNAGITHLPKPMETVDEEEFDRVPKSELVQCLKGLDDFCDQNYGGGTGPLWYPR